MDILNTGNLGNKFLKVPQKCLGNMNSSPSSSKAFVEQKQFPKFLKTLIVWETWEQCSPSSSKGVWRTGAVPQFLKSVWGEGTVR